MFSGIMQHYFTLKSNIYNTFIERKTNEWSYAPLRWQWIGSIKKCFKFFRLNFLQILLIVFFKVYGSFIKI